MATCYTCFDGDNDIRYYRLMQAWHENENFDFTFVNAHDITQARDTSTEEHNAVKTSLSVVVSELEGINTGLSAEIF